MEQLASGPRVCSDCASSEKDKCNATVGGDEGGGRECGAQAFVSCSNEECQSARCFACLGSPKSLPRKWWCSNCREKGAKEEEEEQRRRDRERQMYRQAKRKRRRESEGGEKKKRKAKASKDKQHAGVKRKRGTYERRPESTKEHWRSVAMEMGIKHRAKATIGELKRLIAGAGGKEVESEAEEQGEESGEDGEQLDPLQPVIRKRPRKARGRRGFTQADIDALDSESDGESDGE